MFIIGNFLYAFAHIADITLTFYMWAIIISALLSWVNPDPYNPIVRFLHTVTDPVLSQVRRRVGIAMGIDISPLIVILAIVFIKKFIVASLFDMAFRMK